jgi:hypothetical protein
MSSEGMFRCQHEIIPSSRKVRPLRFSSESLPYHYPCSLLT